MLHEVVSPQIRKFVYVAYALVGFVAGAVQVGYAAAEMGQPVWFVVFWAVYGFTGTAFGFTASSNVNPEVQPDPDSHTPRHGIG